jgi:citrate lyase subunit beta/citryl-CoA lyase
VTESFPTSLLFVPAHDERLRRKAATMERQTLVLDLEDSVPVAEKEAARQGVLGLLNRPSGGVFVRINPLNAATSFSTACGVADLSVVVAPGLRGIVLPKTESAAQVRQIDELLTSREVTAGVPVGAIELLAIVETARGIMELRDIVDATPRRSFRLCFGAGDFATDLHVGWSDTEEESRTARSLLVIASRAGSLPPPIDSVFPNISDRDGLARSTSGARALGFKSKFVIHPSQIAIVDDILRPTKEETRWAQRVVTGMQAAERSQRGAFTLDGRLIDYPIVAYAREILTATDLPLDALASSPDAGQIE